MATARPTMSPETTSASLSFLGPEIVGAILPDVTCDGPFCMMESSLFKDSSCSISDRLAGFVQGFYLNHLPSSPFAYAPMTGCLSNRGADQIRSGWTRKS